MEAPLSVAGPGQAARTILADEIDLSGGRPLRMERKMADDGILGLWPSRRTQSRAGKNPASGEYHRRQLRSDFRKSRTVSQSRFGSRNAQALTLMFLSIPFLTRLLFGRCRQHRQPEFIRGLDCQLSEALRNSIIHRRTDQFGNDAVRNSRLHFR